MISRLFAGALLAALAMLQAPPVHAQKTLLVAEPQHGIGYLPLYVAIRNGYFAKLGLDVKAMRTTVVEESMFHLSHSRTMFLRLLEIVRGVNETRLEELRQARQHEQLEMFILDALMGRKSP